MKNLFLILISFAFFSTPAYAAWTIWVSLGGGIIGDPAACTARGITYVVAKGTDNAFWFRKRTLSTGIWDDWRRVPGTQTFSGSPSAACRTQNNQDLLEVLGVGYDGRIFRNYLTAPPNGWSGYSVLPTTGLANGRAGVGSGLSSAQTLIPGLPAHFVRGSNNILYYATCPGGTCYTNWTAISPIVYNDPAAVYQSTGRLDLVVQATTGTLIHRFYEGGLWYPFNYIGSGSVIGAPDIVSRYQGALDVFFRAPNNTLVQKVWINGIWGNNVNLGSPNNAGITSGPGAVTYAKDASNARIFVFARGSDGALWYRAWAP